MGTIKHRNFRLPRGRGGFVNIGVTNIWIIEFGRIFGKITSIKTFQIRPRIYQIHPRQKSMRKKKKSCHQEITHHCRAIVAAAAEFSILKFQNYKESTRKLMLGMK